MSNNRKAIISALPIELQEIIQQEIDDRVQREIKAILNQKSLIEIGTERTITLIGFVYTLVAGLNDDPPKLAAMLARYPNNLGGEWGQLYPRLEEINAYYLPHLQHMVTECIRGLKRAIDNQDGGEYLRLHIDPRELSRLRDSVKHYNSEYEKRRGAPPKQTPENEYIALRLLAICPSLEYGIDTQELIRALSLLAEDIDNLIDQTSEEKNILRNIESRKTKPKKAADWARKIIESHLAHRPTRAENSEYLSIDDKTA